MKFLSTAALIAALAGFTASPAAALAQYQCVVQDFIGFSDDEAFKQKNRRKTFTLLVKRDEVVVFVKSKDYRDSEQRYVITARNLLDTIALGEMRTSLETLVFPKDPQVTLARKGYFNATIALQSNFYLNTWLLRCAE